jgi:hypothetical protein
VTRAAGLLFHLIAFAPIGLLLAALWSMTS